MQELIMATALSALETRDFEMLECQCNGTNTCYKLELHRMLPFWVHYQHGRKKARSIAQAQADWQEHSEEIVGHYISLLERQQVYIRLNNRFKTTNFQDPDSPDQVVEFLLGVPATIETFKGDKKGQILFGISVPESMLKECTDFSQHVKV